MLFVELCFDHFTFKSIFSMARWPKNAWTTIYTYGSVFVLFPLLAFLCYAWVRGWF